jgi:hypothetical protein
VDTQSGSPRCKKRTLSLLPCFLGQEAGVGRAPPLLAVPKSVVPSKGKSMSDVFCLVEEEGSLKRSCKERSSLNLDLPNLDKYAAERRQT